MRGRIHLRRREDRQPQPAHEFEGIDAIGGDANRRIRLLHRFGNHRQIINTEETPVKRYALVGPCAANYVEPYEEALAALRLRNSEAEEMARN
jgi:hypothetical protein